MSVPRRGLLDTSTVILLGRITDPSLLPDEPVISAITLAELSAGPLVTDDPDERASRQAHLQLAESDFDPLPFDAAAARAFGRIAADLRRADRKPAERAYDALIAATAISTLLPLFTCNPSDFSGIAGLNVWAVPHPDHGQQPATQSTNPPTAEPVSVAKPNLSGKAHDARIP